MQIFFTWRWPAEHKTHVESILSAFALEACILKIEIGLASTLFVKSDFDWADVFTSWIQIFRFVCIRISVAPILSLKPWNMLCTSWNGQIVGLKKIFSGKLWWTFALVFSWTCLYRFEEFWLLKVCAEEYFHPSSSLVFYPLNYITTSVWF